MNSFKVDKFEFSPFSRPFIIAEMSGNHNQSLERALEIVESAANCGAHAIKLQTYTADTITLNSQKKDFVIDDSNSLWNGKNLYDLYKEAYTPWEWHKAIFDKAKSLGILAFSSPFDETAVDFLESLNVPCYKIASFENTHFPLIKKVIRTGKPLIISTGVASLSDLQEINDLLKAEHCTNYVLLKCTSTYPASPENTNLNTIPHMREMFDCPIGLSDHTMGIGASVAAVALGACVIEKHFTLNRADGGVDSAFSLEPDELKALVVETERAALALGKVNYTLSEKEKKSLQFKRSIYVSKPIKAGEAITLQNVRIVRPAMGLPPKFIDFIIENNMKAVNDIEEGTPLSWDIIA